VIDIVLDTNVLVAAVRSRRGAANKILRLAVAGRLRLNISVALALEYEDVLKRDCMVPGYTSQQLDWFLDYLFTISRLHPAVLLKRPSLRDPNDECILEVAVHCGAVIVTHNVRHLGVAVAFGLNVMRPAELLVSIGESR
jgi:putative PIN family toxin of toxin-antitoxin system